MDEAKKHKQISENLLAEINKDSCKEVKQQL